MGSPLCCKRCWKDPAVLQACASAHHQGPKDPKPPHPALMAPPAPYLPRLLFERDAYLRKVDLSDVGLQQEVLSLQEFIVLNLQIRKMLFEALSGPSKDPHSKQACPPPRKAFINCLYAPVVASIQFEGPPPGPRRRARPYGARRPL